MLRWSSLNFASGSPGVGNFSTSRHRIPSPNHHDSSSFPSSPRSCVVNKPLPPFLLLLQPSVLKDLQRNRQASPTTQPADFSRRPQRGFFFRAERTEHLKYHRRRRDGKFPVSPGGVDGRTCQFLITGLEQTTSQPPHTGVSPRKRACCSPSPAN